MATVRTKFRASSSEAREGTLFYQVIHNRVARQIHTGYRVYPQEWTAARRHIPAAGMPGKPARLSGGVKDTDCGGHGTAGKHHFPLDRARTCLYRGRCGATLPHTFGYGRLHVFRMGACQAVKANRQEPHGRALHHRPEQFRTFPRGKRRASGRNGFRPDGKVRDLPGKRGGYARTRPPIICGGCALSTTGRSRRS